MHTDKQKSINLEISYSEIRNLLKKLLNTPHAELLSHVIMGNLDTTSFGLEQTYKAIHGISNELPWKAGQNILIKKEYTYNSQIDWEAMQDKGYLHQGYVKAVITKVDPYAYSQLTIEMPIVTAIESKIFTTTVSANNVKSGEEWPENLDVQDDVAF